MTEYVFAGTMTCERFRGTVRDIRNPDANEWRRECVREIGDKRNGVIKVTRLLPYFINISKTVALHSYMCIVSILLY